MKIIAGVAAAWLAALASQASAQARVGFPDQICDVTHYGARGTVLCG